jgi:hypothetical protein
MDMGDRESLIVGSGQKWMSGTESSTDYFARARAAAAPPGSSLRMRIKDALAKLLPPVKRTSS